MLLVVEGKDDEEFLKAYCQFLGLEKYLILVTGGNKFIHKQAAKIKIEMNKGKQVLIIFDTDKSFTESLESIHHQFKNLGINKEQYAVFLFPKNEQYKSNDEKLELETLIQKIARNQQVFKCLNGYESCLNAIGILSNKAKVYAYKEFYAFQENKDYKTYYWNHGILDFEHQELENLKKFLLHYAQKD